MKISPNSWQQFIDIAEKKCSPIAFQNWLEPIQLKSISNEQIVLSVPNVYVEEYLLEHFKNEMELLFPIESLTFEIQQSKPQAPTKTVTTETKNRLKLHPGYKFEHFVEGTDNQFIKACAQNVAKHPMTQYNPLVIYGDAGLGKTHLLHSIAHELKKTHKHLKIQCITMEGFINELVFHLNNKSMQQMKQSYRNLDVLLIDDIQFLEKRKGFSEEFCNTIEHLISQNKQICIVSDKAPNLLNIDHRITSRFEMGLSCQIKAPSFETKAAILQHKCELAHIEVDEEILLHIAAKPFTNVRQLEGVVYRLKAYSSLKYPIDTPNQVDNLLYDLLPKMEKKPINLDQIALSVAKTFHLEKEQILSSSRSEMISLARQSAMYLAKELSHLPINQIASFFGRTHSTLLHSCKNISQKMQEKPNFQEKLLNLKKSLAQ